MHQVADVEVAKNIMDANKRLADKNLRNLEEKDIFCVDFVGAIGSGKTTLVEEIIDNTDYKIGVLAGDVISKFDGGRIEKHNVPVVGLNTGKECHLELVSPFLSPRAAGLPKLRLCRSTEGDLARRTGSMAGERAADTLATTLPMRREHFMLTHECNSYILDDYRRFPTMEEVFVEITPDVKLRHPRGKTKISVLMNPSVMGGTPRWGDAIVMIDGVPVPDHRLVETYDPAIVKTVEVYPYRYNLGYRVFDGVVNLVTFKGNMPGVMFDDNVRIYDFPGCAWPMAHEGRETPFWHPLVTLQPGEKFEVPSAALEPGVSYTLSVDGLAAGVRPVYLRKSFVR